MKINDDEAAARVIPFKNIFAGKKNHTVMKLNAFGSFGGHNSKMVWTITPKVNTFVPTFLPKIQFFSCTVCNLAVLFNHDPTTNIKSASRKPCIYWHNSTIYTIIQPKFCGVDRMVVWKNYTKYNNILYRFFPLMKIYNEDMSFTMMIWKIQYVQFTGIFSYDTMEMQMVRINTHH